MKHLIPRVAAVPQGIVAALGILLWTSILLACGCIVAKGGRHADQRTQVGISGWVDANGKACDFPFVRRTGRSPISPSAEAAAFRRAEEARVGLTHERSGSIIQSMKLVVNIKLMPTSEQEVLLRDTLERCNAACSWVSKQAWDTRTFGQFALQALTYRHVREEFGLTAQVAVRTIAKVVDSYKANRKSLHAFRKCASQPYDDRIFRIVSDDLLSIWLLGGRQKIAYQCGERQRLLLAHRKGEVDLMFVRGQWYIAVVCDIDEPDIIDTTDVLGVDLGIVNIATDSDGRQYSGAAVESHRRRHAHRRRNLQRKGTKSAKRKLKRISGQQARFQTDTNHCISKSIVAEAQRTGRGIALEDLGGIRGRVTARKSQRARLANWGFGQLRGFIGYKAALMGIPVVAVDPRNTSRECPSCGHIDKANRRTQAEFVCVQCSFAGNADVVAATNIRQRALAARAIVNTPMVAGSVAQASVS